LAPTDNPGSGNNLRRRQVKDNLSRRAFHTCKKTVGSFVVCAKDRLLINQEPASIKDFTDLIATG
jgi:hypothetical protein